MTATERLYLQDDHALAATATVMARRDDGLALDRTCFYPGGGGQPADCGTIELAGGARLNVTGVQVEDGTLWHLTDAPPPADAVGRPAALAVDGARRVALSRYHTVLHVLNTLALRDYGAWITGAQIAPDYARIDFKFEGFSPAVAAELEAKVNAVLAGEHRLRAYYVSEEEFRRRDDLRRTLTAEPPVVDGQVRVVEIGGFDAQACGGTHVGALAELGRCAIYKTENKGRINKRLYVRLS
ncbi:MAG: alanyl-tRNA editing protein [Deltaproteobacteria bacterium]|nr:alanyl-tRNA editing protein [Deltaproteobacteria bacterium]